MHSRSPRQTRTILSLALLVILQAATPALAWGRLGHRVISRIAEKQLTAEAKAAIAELLEPGESLADVSLWGDENRGRLPKTAPWHYVDLPLDEPRYDARFSGDVSTKGCVVDKIHEFRLTLKPFAYVRALLVALSSERVDLESLLPDVWIAAHPDHVLQYRRDEAEAAANRRRRRRELRREKVRGAQPESLMLPAPVPAPST